MQPKQIMIAIAPAVLFLACLTVCGSSSNTLGVTSGAADSHCVGVTPQEANICICDGAPSGSYNPCTSVSDGNSTDGNVMDSNATNSNSTNSNDSNTMADPGGTESTDMQSDYGPTMYGAQGDDDDCKYHVNWSMSSVGKNSDVTFKVSATRLVEKTPLTNAATRAEVFLSDTHPAPNTKPAQSVIEDPPGTYTISPVVFDASGVWTVRFHFFELCDDTLDNSDHGHAAFYVTIP